MSWLSWVHQSSLCSVKLTWCSMWLKHHVSASWSSNCSQTSGCLDSQVNDQSPRGSVACFAKWVAAEVNGLKHARSNSVLLRKRLHWYALQCNGYTHRHVSGFKRSHSCSLSSWIWRRSPQRWRIWSRCSWFLWVNTNITQRDHKHIHTHIHTRTPNTHTHTPMESCWSSVMCLLCIHALCPSRHHSYLYPIVEH